MKKEQVEDVVKSQWIREGQQYEGSGEASKSESQRRIKQGGLDIQWACDYEGRSWN